MTVSHKNTAFVLVGGLGTRLRSLFPNTPKPLVPLGGEVFLKSLLERLRKVGISRAVLLSGYKGNEFEEFVRTIKISGLSVSLSQEDKPLGSAGAVGLAFHNMNKQFEDIQSVLVVNGDTWYEGDLNHFVQSDLHTDYKVLLSYKEPADRYGLVNLDMSNVIKEFKEKQSSSRGWVHSGFAILQKNLLDSLSPDHFLTLEKDIFNKFQGYGCKQEGNFFDFGVPEDYFDLNRDRWLQRSSELGTGIKQKILGALEVLSPVRINDARYSLKEPNQWVDCELKALDDSQIEIAENILDSIDSNLKSDLEHKVVNPTLFLNPKTEYFEKKPALFLDRDGTLIDHVHYIREPKKVKLLDDVSRVLKQYKSSGYRLILVTNQSGVGREYFNWNTYQRVHSRMLELFKDQGVEIDWTFASSYYEKANRWTGLVHNWQRKPFGGMARIAELGFNIDLKNSIMIGDSHVDAGFAHMSQLKECYWINGKLSELSKNPKEFKENQTTKVHFVSAISKVPVP